MKKKIKYESSPWKDDPPGKIKIIPDFLPSPAELAEAEKRQKITLDVSAVALHFFKSQAKQFNIPYQVMIRRVLDSYASRHLH